MKMKSLLTGLVAASGIAATAAPPLAAYVGKYPFDKVRGVTFLNHPLVRSLVTAHAPAGLRPTIMSAGVAGPIGRSRTAIVAAICEPHNCGMHNWTIAISRTGKSAVICHYDAEQGENAAWYHQRKLIASVAGSCTDDEMAFPSAVRSRL